MANSTQRTAGSKGPVVTTRLLRAVCCLLLAVAAGTSTPRAQQAGAQGGQQGTLPPASGQQAGGQAPAGQGDTTFRSGINFVTVDTYDSDNKGQPVLISQSDFQLTETINRRRPSSSD
jgi:hypothetical protein